MKSYILLGFSLCITSVLFSQDTLRYICTDNTIEGINTSIDFYKKRLEKDCNDQTALYAVGMSYYKLGKMKNAIVYFDQLVAVNPKYEGAFYNRGVCKYFLKDKTGACYDFEQALKNGDNPKAIEGKKLSTFVKKECVTN